METKNEERGRETNDTLLRFLQLCWRNVEYIMKGTIRRASRQFFEVTLEPSRPRRKLAPQGKKHFREERKYLFQVVVTFATVYCLLSDRAKIDFKSYRKLTSPVNEGRKE